MSREQGPRAAGMRPAAIAAKPPTEWCAHGDGGTEAAA